MGPLARLFGLATGLALLGLPVRNAVAQTSIDYFAHFGPTSTVQYLPFTVSGAGIFQMLSSGPNHIDPAFLLFTGTSFDGTGLGSLLAANDDGGPAQAGWNSCTGLGGSCHAFLSASLGPGAYTLAMSVPDFTQSEARSGEASFDGVGFYDGPWCNDDGEWSDCNYAVSLTSRNGTASAVEVVPEPATMSLLATGLVGLTAVRRRITRWGSRVSQ